MNTVEEALAPERKNINFSIQKMSEFLYGKEYYGKLKEILNTRPHIAHDFNIYNKGRIQIFKNSFKELAKFYNATGKQRTELDDHYLFLASMNQIPGSIHISMFVKCIQIMGTNEQHKEYLSKSRNYDIIGCYAQTQIAHGSDVRGLLTTATFDIEKDQFIINTPSIQAAKYWPGDLGFFATHALVFAELIVKGKKHGIHSFIVPIRDQQRNPLPGIQTGDIGPKIGFASKDNGYLMLDNIRIPRKNMLRRFISVSMQGQLKIKGDPKVSYATMMDIRKLISCGYPKIYSSAITIATRYSFYRRQFKDSKKEQIRVIDYQLQQEKIIERVSEFYAITVSANKIREICAQNIQAVLEKESFIYMAQTHACLCLGKAFYSETVYNGMQICRKACGGHGFSHYSGLPSLINEYACNLTHEGQNTILYLQVARYLMKSYKHFMTKKKPIGDSVKYIESYDFLISKKCEIEDAQKWTLEDIRILLAQGVLYLINVITQKIMSKSEDISNEEVLNKHAGVRLQNLAILHAAYYTFDGFKEAIFHEKDEKIKEIMTQLCFLYGTNLLLKYSSPIIEGQYIQGHQLSSLSKLKEVMLKKLRPNLIGMVDAFGVPDRFIRSALISGNPYDNYLKLARENEINHGYKESAKIVLGIKDHIKNPNPKL